MRLRACILPGIILCLLTLLAACSDPEVDRILRDAEALMELRPDSSLTILETINGATLSGERRARHALLLSQAYDKNNIDLTSDSLISIAADYYSDSPNLRYKMLSHYYTAVAYSNHNLDKASLRECLIAYDIAAELNDPLNLSRIECYIGRLYSVNHNEAEALKWDLLSLEHAKLCDKTEWIANSYRAIGNDYLALSQHKHAIQYADSALIVSGDSRIRAQAQEIKYIVFYFQQEEQKADSIYNILKQLNYKISDNVNEAQYSMGDLSTEEIIAYQSSAIERQNEYIQAMTLSNLDEVRQQHDLYKQHHLEKSIKEKRIIIFIVLIISCITIIYLSILVRYKHLKYEAKNLESENKLQSLLIDRNRIHSELQAAKHTISDLNKDEETLSTKNNDYLKAYEHLKLEASLIFIKEYSWIDKLGELYLNSTLKLNPKKDSLSKEIENELAFSNPAKLLSKIEEHIKKNNPELHSEINRWGLSESDKGMLFLFIIGISTRVICFITKKSTAAIYSAKNRIKGKIKHISSPYSSLILSFL